MVLVPASTTCAVACGSGDVAAEPMADHCGEGNGHVPTGPEEPMGPGATCEDCELHAAPAVDEAAATTADPPDRFEAPVAIVGPRSVGVPVGRSAALRGSPLSRGSPRPPLAITHAPLLI
jgi:hypothetical protein